MKVTWGEGNHLIESGKVELKKVLLANPYFSRSKDNKRERYEKVA